MKEVAAVVLTPPLGVGMNREMGEINPPLRFRLAFVIPLAVTTLHGLTPHLVSLGLDRNGFSLQEGL
jgi:hypothetical protein